MSVCLNHHFPALKKDAIQRQTLLANLEAPFGLWETSVMKSGISREAWPAPTEIFAVQNTDTWVEERKNTTVGRAFQCNLKLL